MLTATSPTASAWVLPRQLVLAELAYGPVTLSDRTITIPATGTPAEVTGFTTDVFAGTLFDRPLSGRLRYTGTATAVFAVSWSVSCRLASSTSRRVRLHLAKNGVAVPNSYVRQLLTSTSDYNSVTSQQLVSLAPNDYVSLFVTNEGSADGVAFAQFSLLAQGVV